VLWPAVEMWSLLAGDCCVVDSALEGCGFSFSTTVCWIWCVRAVAVLAICVMWAAVGKSGVGGGLASASS